MNRVFKTELGEYLTYPDGDKASLEEIIKYELARLHPAPKEEQ